MIRREIDMTVTQPHCIVMEILRENQQYYLTKEEIYERVPYIDNEKSITISQLETTLRQMRNCRQIDVLYIKHRTYYALVLES